MKNSQGVYIYIYIYIYTYICVCECVEMLEIVIRQPPLTASKMNKTLFYVFEVYTPYFLDFLYLSLPPYIHASD